MSIARPVLVAWDDWKRNSLPAGGWYSTLAEFPDVPEARASDGAWSTVPEFDVAPAWQGDPSAGTARFPVGNGPHEWLRIGTRFDMYGERKRSAVVRIVG